MSIGENINLLEKTLKELSVYESQGLDTSSLRLFVKNLKLFHRIQQTKEKKIEENTTFEEKLNII